MRFIDENIAPATAADFAWADVGFGQRHAHPGAADPRHPPPRQGGRQGHGARRAVGVGVPEMYPEFDYLHIGEIGDAHRRADRAARRELRAAARADALPDQGAPAAHRFSDPGLSLVPLARYLMCTLQFSSGCPYRCEFCDIPNLYGRQPRLKTAGADHRRARRHAARRPDHPPQVYFVDDNFIGNRKAAREMLPHLVAWQKKHGYPMQFACEATLNIAKQAEILSLMREAAFRRHVRRHRDAGGRRAQGDAQGSEQFAADDGCDQDAQRLRSGGDFRHHPRARYRHATIPKRG